ncbi:AAA family ATPase [Chloroflexus sp.]|uniref:AAA family ATPase n=1 Tax=Chloroflexus sp. TaxID=1904827 RepID=UPI002ADE1E68|nr:AAA family ATPase [Chloroflexus sp.]
MEQQTSSQLFRAYVPATLHNQLSAGLLRAGQIQTYHGTILYTDLSGFTRLTATFATLPDGAEHLHGILTSYFEIMIATIVANGGDVIHIAGDALTAWWPGMTDPALAIHCGHALHNAIAALNPIATPNGPFTLEIRVGVSVGIVHLLLVGIPNQGVHPVLIGAPIDAASLAEQQAKPGEVQLLLPSSRPTRFCDYRPPPETPILTWEHFLPPSFARRLRLNTLVAEYRWCVPVFAAFDLPDDPTALQPLVMQAQAIAMRWGGWLNEIEVGNKGAVMVFLFGAPVAHGDDTSRAVGCAVELRDRGIIRKAGITVGSVFVGEVGSRLRRVYTAQGEDMNLAALLMEQGQPGDVVISGRVRQDILGRYRTSLPQQLNVKGYSRSIPTAVVLAKHTFTDERPFSSLKASLPDNTELIGRAQERQMIDHILDVARQEGQVLLIEGEASIGKSSLIHHLSARWIKDGYQGFRGECRSGMQEWPLHLWRNILSELCDIDDSAPMQVRQARLQHIATTFSSARPQHIATLAHLFKIDGFDSTTKSTDISPLVVDLLLSRLKQEPLLMVLEDIHWADTASLKLAQDVIEALLPQLPLLVVISYRPAPKHLASFTNHIRQYPFTTHHVLERLPVYERAILIRQLIGVKDIDHRLLHYLERYAAGQPLFIKEYVRLLLQKELIAIENDTARLLRPLPPMQLSSSALGIVQAHIDRMEERTRLTFKAAAVIGRSFPLRLLHHIHPARITESELREDIKALLHDQLIEMEMAEPEPVYRFIDGIAYEAAYTSLLFAQRRHLHQAISNWYLSTYQQELAEQDAPLAVYDVIIDHSIRAELWSTAVDHCWQAALICARRSLFHSALRYIEQGVGLAGPASRRIDLIGLRMLLNDRIGNHIYQEEDFHLIQQLLNEQAQPAIQALAAVLYLHHVLVSGQFALIDEQMTYAQATVRQGHHHAGFSRLLQACIWLINAQYLALQGQSSQALEILRRVNRLCALVPRQVSTPQPLSDLIRPDIIIAQSYELEGWIQFELGVFQRATRRFQQAIKLARAANDWIVENRALIGLCHVMLFSSQHEIAEEQLPHTLYVARAINDRYGQVLGLRTQALLHVKRNDIRTARRLIWQAIAIANSSQIGILEIVLLNDLEKSALVMEQDSKTDRAD